MSTYSTRLHVLQAYFEKALGYDTLIFVSSIRIIKIQKQSASEAFNAFLLPEKQKCHTNGKQDMCCLR